MWLGVGDEVELLFTDDEDPKTGLPGVLEVPGLEELVAADDDAAEDDATEELCTEDGVIGLAGVEDEL